MKQLFTKKFTWLFTLALAALVVIPFAAFADDISNNLDGNVDAVAEVMSLNAGGANGTTQLYVVPANGDGKNGCNLTGSTTLGLSISSGSPSVATVSPSSVTFTSCGDTPTLMITPVGQGSASISVSQTSNSTGGTFNLAPATFTVNVAAATPSNTAPSVSVSGVTAGGSYDKGSVPAATCDVVDSEDGNSSFGASLSTITGTYASDGIGSQTASCSYTDGGGLTASASKTYTIVDPSAPSIGYTLNPASPDGSDGWYKSAVTLTWNVSDPESPNSLSQTGCVNQNVTADQAETSYDCSATSAGGSAGPVTVSIKRDGTNPTISGSAAPAANGAGWNNADVAVSFLCGDNLSGVASCGPDQTLSSEGAGQAAIGDAVDNAGNTASVTVSGINIDRTDPVVAVTGVANGATYTLGSVPAAGCSTTDGLSGVATSATLSSSGGPVGEITATCSGATDVAGNAGSASAKYSVIYNWTGFFQPVDNLPALNRAKAGSAIPVKFSLSGNQGLSIFAEGYPKSTLVNCGATAVDDIESTVTAGSSSLSYDALANQYVYVWKTDKAWAGTCRTLTVKLNDGTIHQANFQLTK